MANVIRMQRRKRWVRGYLVETDGRSGVEAAVTSKDRQRIHRAWERH